MAEPTPRVLVVDDERFFREAIGEALAAAGIACDVAVNGEEALEAIVRGGVGVVVLDIQLPGMSGIEVLREIEARDPAVHVIILSAHTNQEEVLEALRRHACDYLAKPLHDEELVLTVRRALASFSTQASFSALRGSLTSLDVRLAVLSERALACGDADRAERLGDAIAEAAAEVVGAAKTSLMVPDPDGGDLVVVASAGRKLLPGEMDSVPAGEGVAGVAFARGEVILVDDIAADDRFEERPDRYASRALAIVPVPGEDGPAAVLCATDRPGGATFGEEEVALLSILARETGRLLAKPSAAPLPEARSPEDSDLTLQVDAREAADSIEDAELAREICEGITTEVEPDRLITAAVRAVAKRLPAAPVSVYLVDNVSGELRLEGQWEADGPSDRKTLPRTRGLTGAVLQTGQLVATDEPERDPRFDPEVDTPEGGVAAPLLCVPLRLRGKTLGVLRAFPGSGAGARARTGEVLSFALSAAIRNVLLYRSLLESIEDLAKVRREAGGA